MKHLLIKTAASVAVILLATDYRGNWFYIDDSDLESKATLSLLSQVFALQA